MGVANDKSIAWHIAKSCYQNGAEVILSYSSEMLEKRVIPLAEEIGSQDKLIMCDVGNQNDIEKAFTILKERFNSIDFVVHAIAFTDKNELKGRYLDTSAENFQNCMNISCYSFTAISRYASSIMKEGGSIITLSYYGSEKVIPNYNVMGVAKAALEASVRYIAEDLGVNGIRVNAISAGPVRTLASSAISGFKDMLGYVEKNAPLRRNISGEDVANTALYLLGDLSKNVTGEIIHVDSGYHIIGMGANII